jgi:hypothetical protein
VAREATARGLLLVALVTRPGACRLRLFCDEEVGSAPQTGRTHKQTELVHGSRSPEQMARTFALWRAFRPFPDGIIDVGDCGLDRQGH